MSLDTSISLVGNLGHDPELRFTQNGKAVCNFSVACREQVKDDSGGYKDRAEGPSWVDVVAWNDLAQHVADSCTSGSRVLVTGRLVQRVWETQDGDKRYKLEVLADDVAASLRFGTVEGYVKDPKYDRG